MDLQELASGLTAQLVPFVPYLVQGGKTVGEEALKKFGEGVGGATWERVKCIWGKLWPRWQEKPAAQEAVADVAKDPKDEDAQAALRLQIKKTLAEDASLVAELTRLLAELGPRISYQAKVTGDGAAAQGPGATALGKGAKFIREGK